MNAPDNWQDRGNCVAVDPDLSFPERGESVVHPQAVPREATP